MTLDLRIESESQAGVPGRSHLRDLRRFLEQVDTGKIRLDQESRLHIFDSSPQNTSLSALTLLGWGKLNPLQRFLVYLHDIKTDEELLAKNPSYEPTMEEIAKQTNLTLDLAQELYDQATAILLKAASESQSATI